MTLDVAIIIGAFVIVILGLTTALLIPMTILLWVTDRIANFIERRAPRE